MTKVKSNSPASAALSPREKALQLELETSWQGQLDAKEQAYELQP